MHSKWEAIRGSSGFYVTMVVCLLVVGLGGYFLLVDKESPSGKPAESPVTDTTVAAPAPEPQTTGQPEETVQVIAPEPMEAEKPSMPQIEIDDTPVMAEAPRLIVSPLQGEVVMAFSVDQLAYNPTLEDWRIHDGIDIAAEEGTTVLSASSGTVLAVENDALMGTTVTIEHAGGYQTTYANLQEESNVETGDSVSAGQIIGAVGVTAAAEATQGPHLHFSVTKDGDAVDPNEYLER